MSNKYNTSIITSSVLKTDNEILSSNFVVGGVVCLGIGLGCLTIYLIQSYLNSSVIQPKTNDPITSDGNTLLIENFRYKYEKILNDDVMRVGDKDLAKYDAIMELKRLMDPIHSANSSVSNKVYVNKVLEIINSYSGEINYYDKNAITKIVFELDEVINRINAIYSPIYYPNAQRETEAIAELMGQPIIEPIINTTSTSWGQYFMGGWEYITSFFY